MAGQPSGKLAVILHADVVGSTQLVQRDERLAHKRITETFQRFSLLIQQYGGHVHEIRGDALVAEFTRASDAVCAAIGFQRSNATRNELPGDGIAPEVRVGISLGEVIIADKTVTGAGVVLAQRVEQLAEAGGVCITEAIREATPSRIALDTRNLGEQNLKGFEQPVHVHATSLQAGATVPPPEPRQSTTRQKKLVGIGVAAAVIVIVVAWFKPWQFRSDSASLDRMAKSPPTKLSIAVLPFENMSNNPDQEYFSDGLTEDIITDLARLSGLLVIARNSSFAYKGQAINMQQIGRELGVRYLVEGSVRRAQNRVRVTAQLIDSESGMHVWAERYDRDVEDIFVLQDELTQTIVDALSVELTPEEADALSDSPKVGADAYDLLLQGNDVMSRFSADAMIEAREIYRKVVRLNPRYARAHANIAFTHAQEALFGWTQDVEETIRLGREAAEEARRLDDRIPQLHLVLGNLHGAALQWEDAANASRRSITLEPSYADGHVMLAVATTFLGDLETASLAIEEAKRLNPRYSFIYIWVDARIRYLQEHYAEAALMLEDAVERNPEFDQTHIMLAATYGQLGRIDDAQWEAEQVLMLQPNFTIESDIRVRGFRDPEHLARYVEGLKKAGLPSGDGE